MFVCWPIHRAPHQEDCSARANPCLFGPRRLPDPSLRHSSPLFPCRLPMPSPPEPSRPPQPPQRGPSRSASTSPFRPAPGSPHRLPIPSPRATTPALPTSQCPARRLTPRRLPWTIRHFPAPADYSPRRRRSHPEATSLIVPLHRKPRRLPTPADSPNSPNPVRSHRLACALRLSAFPPSPRRQPNPCRRLPVHHGPQRPPATIGIQP